MEKSEGYVKCEYSHIYQFMTFALIALPPFKNQVVRKTKISPMSNNCSVRTIIAHDSCFG